MSDKGSAFISQNSKEAAETLALTPTHAMTKHAQTNGKLERTKASLGKRLKFERDERGSIMLVQSWYNYANFETLNYNNSFHKSVEFDFGTLLNGSTRSVLDLKNHFPPPKLPKANFLIAQEFLSQTETVFQNVGENTLQAFI